MLYYPRTVVHILLVLSVLHFDQVLCRGGRGGEGGGAPGGSGGSGGSGDSGGSSLNLSPNMTAVFALTVVIAIITLFQLVLSTGRFKKRELPPDELPSPDHDVGPIFLKLLFSYLLIFLTSNILYAVAVAFREANTIFAIFPGGLLVATAFTGQLAYTLLFAMLLCIIRHRQRIQLSPYGETFNLKFFFEASLLLVILAMGITQDAVAINSPFPGLDLGVDTEDVLEKRITEALDAQKFTVVFHVLVFVATLYVTGYAVLIHTRFRRANIQDRIIWTAAFLTGPTLLVVTLYRLITVSLAFADLTVANSFRAVRSATAVFDMQELLIADTVIGGLVFLFVADCCMRMGAPLKAEKKKV